MASLRKLTNAIVDASLILVGQVDLIEKFIIQIAKIDTFEFYSLEITVLRINS